MNITISPENSSSGVSYNILVLLESDIDDIGYYIPTDGDILQEKNKCNFTYTVTGNTITVFNSVDKNNFVELKEVYYKIFWGDGYNDDISIEQSIDHTYADSGSYTLTLNLESPWTDKVVKTINVGTDSTIPNSLGTLTITVPYSDTVIDMDFISEHDQICEGIENQGIVSGFTSSRLSELYQYGQTELIEGLDSDGNGILEDGITENYTAYTIDNIFYTDFPDGLCYFQVDAGENPIDIICQLITKDDAMMGVVQDIEVQSDVYVERGTISVFEHNLRLCEIRSTGEIQIYGNGYFNIKKSV